MKFIIHAVVLAVLPAVVAQDAVVTQGRVEHLQRALGLASESDKNEDASLGAFESILEQWKNALMNEPDAKETTENADGDKLLLEGSRFLHRESSSHVLKITKNPGFSLLSDSPVNCLALFQLTKTAREAAIIRAKVDPRRLLSRVKE